MALLQVATDAAHAMLSEAFGYAIGPANVEGIVLFGALMFGGVYGIRKLAKLVK